MQKKEWFAEWFDTPYYHILYKNRDNHEARVFIKSLVDLLQLPEASSVLDLACGKGRHSITLNEFGYNVLGVDLSAQSIAHANQFSNPSLSFAVQDMRQPIESKQFDAVMSKKAPVEQIQTRQAPVVHAASKKRKVSSMSDPQMFLKALSQYNSSGSARDHMEAVSKIGARKSYNRQSYY